jgi:capsular exopolysaccharide synthesis family protein
MALTINGDTAVQLSDYIAVLARRKLVLLAGIVLGVAAAVGYSYGIATPAYVSQAEVLVRPVVDRPFNPGTAGIDKALNMGTEKTVATSNAVAQIVKDTLKLPDDVTTIAGRATAQTVGTTQLLQISYTDRTRTAAQKGAQAFAEAYLRFKSDLAVKSRDDVRTNIVKPLQALDDQINALRADIAKAAATPNNPALALGQTRLQDLQSQAQQYNQSLAALDLVDVNDTGSIVSPAVLPTKPLSPRPKVFVAIGAVVGLLLGVLAAFLGDRLGGRLRDPLDLEDHLGAPLLVSIPRTRRQGRRPVLATLSPEDTATGRAYRILRAKVLAQAQRGGVKTVLVAGSTGDDSGGGIVAANLAVSLAQVGKRVVFVSADLHHSRADQFFSVDGNRGLANVLNGELPPPDAAQRPNGVDRLAVYTAGRSSAEGDDLLGSDAMRRFLDISRSDADFVVIEAPPALEASGCLALAPLADGVLVVADARRSRRDAVARTQLQFAQVGAPVLGAVLSNGRESA